MAIFTIKETVGSKDSIKKTIGKNNEGVALDILQRGIYAHPIESTIRELASNAYDAIKEREVAKSILNGDSLPEDHFDMNLTGDIYNDSKWNPAYFDLKYLSDDNTTYIFYEEGVRVDTLRIVDNGVGIGQSRMTGYFSLGWSSKRTQKGALGKWGLGNKVALSLNIDSYTVVSRYNGRKFRFEVYLDNIIPATPKFSKTGPNGFIDLEVPDQTDDGKSKTFRFYYEDTDEPNGLEVVVPIKKHNKTKIFEAVESQLMYLPNVLFQVLESGETSYKKIDIAAEILYKDQNVIISASTIFNKPHILLGTGDGFINYGFVAFKELELEEKQGAVGLILDINDVEVTPSRESVIWSPKTRAAVLKSYDAVTKTATAMINKTLSSETDYFKWIINAAKVKNSIANKSTANSDKQAAFQKLASIVDPSSIKNLIFNKHTRPLAYTVLCDDAFSKKVLIRAYRYDSYKHSVERTKLKNTSSLASYDKFYLLVGASDKYVDRYLYETNNSNAYVVVKLLEGYEVEDLALLVEHSSAFLDYNSIVVPEDTKDGYLLEEANGASFEDEEDDTVEVIDGKRLAALRNPFSYTANEIKITDIYTHFFQTNVVYSTYGDRDLLNDTFSVFPEYLLGIKVNRYSSEYSTFVSNDTYRDAFYKHHSIKEHLPILVATENEKYFRNLPSFSPIGKFVVESYKDGVLTFNKHIRLVHTHIVARKLLDELLNYTTNSFIRSVSMLADNSIYELLTAILAGDRAVTSRPQGFYRICVEYDTLKLNGAEKSTLDQYLEELNDKLPDQLCDLVDEITDINLLDIPFLKALTEFLSYYAQFSPLFSAISGYKLDEAIEALNTFIRKYETPPALPYKY